MRNIDLLEELFDDKLIRMLQLFLENKDKQFYLREIAKESGVPLATSSRLLSKLVKLEVIRLIKISKFKIYQLSDNEDTKFLRRFLKKDVQILDRFVQTIKVFPEIERIILHGEENKDRANVLLIGEDIDANEVKEVVAGIKEGSNFTVSALVLTTEQYEQMSEMGLYPGKKKILFERE
jgi:hypothetical protein